LVQPLNCGDFPHHQVQAALVQGGPDGWAGFVQIFLVEVQV